jgi:hypothetical protein
MSRTPTEAVGHKAARSTALGSAVRALALAGATITTGLIAGVFYAYAVSVNLGLAAQPDASYVATMQAINERIQNPLFFLSLFGAVLFLLAALAVHYRRPRTSRTGRQRRGRRERSPARGRAPPSTGRTRAGGSRPG